jgi:peptide/nickel transport system substrate-binding protein
VTDWSDSKRTLTLVRNPEYHGEPAALDGLIVRFITRQEVAVALSEGQLDAVGPLQAPLLFTPTTMLVDLSYPSARITYLAANFSPRNEEPLESEVRQALAQALDRQAILAELLGGDGQLLPGSLLPDHWAAGDDLAAPEYDPEAARALLAQAGLRDSDGDGWLDREGRRLELGIRTNGDNLLHQQLAWLASSYYRKLGLFARAEGVPFDSLVDDLFTHDFRLAIFSWPVLVDPDQRLYWHSQEETEGVGLNFTSYSNPSLDNLLERGVSIPGCRPEARAQVYNQVQEILAQDRPVDFLFTPNLHVLVGSRLHGLEPGPFAPFTWNATGWYLQQ